jgi:hypothetical protein
MACKSVSMRRACVGIRHEETYWLGNPSTYGPALGNANAPISPTQNSAGGSRLRASPLQSPLRWASGGAPESGGVGSVQFPVRISSET